MTKRGPVEMGMANYFSILALRNQCTVLKKQKDITLKDEPPRSVGIQYATGEEWRKSCRRNEETELKCKVCPAVDVSGGENKLMP